MTQDSSTSQDQETPLTPDESVDSPPSPDDSVDWLADALRATAPNEAWAAGQPLTYATGTSLTEKRARNGRRLAIAAASLGLNATVFIGLLLHPALVMSWLPLAVVYVFYFFCAVFVVLGSLLAVVLAMAAASRRGPRSLVITAYVSALWWIGPTTILAIICSTNPPMAAAMGLCLLIFLIPIIFILAGIVDAMFA